MFSNAFILLHCLKNHHQCTLVYKDIPKNVKGLGLNLHVTFACFLKVWKLHNVFSVNGNNHYTNLFITNYFLSCAYHVYIFNIPILRPFYI